METSPNVQGTYTKVTVTIKGGMGQSLNVTAQVGESVSQLLERTNAQATFNMPSSTPFSDGVELSGGDDVFDGQIISLTARSHSKAS